MVYVKAKPKALPRLAIYEKEYKMLVHLLDSDTHMNAAVYSAMRVLCAVLYSTGLRISEALNMSREDVEAFARGETVTVDCTKTSTTRQLLTIASLSQVVNEAITNPRVQMDFAMAASPRRGFVTAYGTRLSTRRAEKHMYRLMHQLETAMRGSVADPEKLRYNSHSFRVGFITRMTRHLPVTDVSYIIGHSNLQTTFTYLRSERDMTRFNKQLAEAVI